MTPPVSRKTAAGHAYLDLKAKAQREARATDELIQLYVLEGFLARLAASAYARQFVLKGGVLLAAFGTRRPTRDVDLAAVDTDNSADHILGVVREVAGHHPEADDGLFFDVERASAEVIRDDAEYAGVRVSMVVGLATARTRFHVDVNMGDPIWPAPEIVKVPRLLGGEPLEVPGYPLHMVHAEKIVTAIQRGTVNTRWRDFGDVWTLSGVRPIEEDDLRAAVDAVATHRGVTLEPLSRVLAGYADIAQARWAAWRRKQQLTTLPEDFADLLEDVFAFSDPVIDGGPTNGRIWDARSRAWVERPVTAAPVST